MSDVIVPPHGSREWSQFYTDLPHYTRVLRPIEQWALNNHIRHHTEALVQYGERVVVRKVWQWQHERDGLVDRCSECHSGDTSSVQERLSGMYKQSGDSRCESCYGVGFEGGFQPEVWVTYALIVDSTEPNIRKGPSKGQVRHDKTRGQYLPVPRLKSGDLLVRVLEWEEDLVTPAEEDRRYLLSTVTPQTIRTSTRNGRDPNLLVGQISDLESLPSDHHFMEVPVA